MGLSDYNTDTFVIDHSSDGVILNSNLSDGESEFVRKIEANYMKSNDYLMHFSKQHMAVKMIKQNLIMN